eukprot:scaffold10708_cov117-Isochrysis_galbana.AAC.4
MLADGRMDELSLHGGCDVLDQNQTKYSANFWLVCPRPPALPRPQDPEYNPGRPCILGLRSGRKP